MIRTALSIIAVILAGASHAEVVTPTKTIRANTIIVETDVAVVDGSNPNAFGNVHDVIGQEAKVTLYAGRPIRYEDIGPPAIVTRNQIVALRFASGGLRIETEGRSLERGGVGDRVRVMNLSSRTTLFGQIQPDGSVKVLR